MTLDDLVALNDEIASLVRAGVPLEAGLTELAKDLPGRLGKCTMSIARQTSQGKPLAQAIASETSDLPPSYRAILEAGIRANRLPAALETVTTSMRRLVQTHRTATITFIYPMFVLLVAWCCFLVFTCSLAQPLSMMFHEFHVPDGGFWKFLAVLRHSVWYWGPVVPILLGLLTVGWLRASSDSQMLHRFFGWFPWSNSMIHSANTATFLEILALLLENETPIPEAMVLAADASGDHPMATGVRQAAAAIAAGQPLWNSPKTMPPMVRWLMQSTGRNVVLIPALHNMAAGYRRRMQYHADMFRVFFPVLTTLFVGGGVTVLYALAVFWPYVTLLKTLT